MYSVSGIFLLFAIHHIPGCSYELCTLKRPFDAKNLPSIVMKICHGDPKPVSSAYSLNLRCMPPLVLMRAVLPQLTDACCVAAAL